MARETKLFINRTDSLETVVDKIIHAPTFVVVLVIPRDATLGHSLSNFNAVKRESDTAGKALMIESSDEHILELAAKAKIVAENPPKSSERPSMDIVRRAAEPISKAKQSVKSAAHGKTEKKSESESVPVHHIHHAEESAGEQNEPSFFKPLPPHARIDLAEADIHEEEFESPKKKKSQKKKKLIFAAAGIVSVFVGWYALAVLPRATITLMVKHIAVQSEDTVRIGKGYKEASISGGALLVPGELFSEKGNLVMSFPANGTENVETKATGKLTVYNAYSVAPQLLIKATRFESPDGKIFRLDKAVSIPGAKSVKGKLVPSKVEASVTADKAGDEYNISPATHWTIPGFKGTPRFNGFYADSLDSMAGGAIGLRPTLSAADRANAENVVSDALRTSLGMRILAMADKFKSFASSTSFAITKTEERVDTNDKTKFGLYMEGTMKQLVFDEQMVKDAIVEKARTDETAADTADITQFEYGEPTFDFTNGTIMVAVKSSVIFTPHVNLAEMKNNIAGSTKSSAEMTILGIPRLDSANIAFWPFWVSSIPSKVSHIDILVK